MAELRVADITQDQLHASILAVAWSLEDDDPAAPPAAVRGVLASVEEQLLSAWADVLLARWDGDDGLRAVGGTGVA